MVLQEKVRVTSDIGEVLDWVEDKAFVCVMEQRLNERGLANLACAEYAHHREVVNQLGQSCFQKSMSVFRRAFTYALTITTTRSTSIDPAEPATFSHDIAQWYMKRHGMPTAHLFGYDMGSKVCWNNPGAFDFLQAVADYVKQHDIQIVLLAPGTPMIVRDLNNRHNLALDSLAGHALWFAHVKKEAPACIENKYVGPTEEQFNAQSTRSLLFFGREGNTTSFIDVESSICEAMAQDAITQGVSTARIVRVRSKRGWDGNSCLQEPIWDYAAGKFMNGSISPKINPLIFSAGGVNNTKEDSTPWPNSLNVQPGLVGSVSVSNGRTFAGSLLKRGATTIVVNIQHPRNARLHAWLSVFRQLIAGATSEANIGSRAGASK